MPLPERVIEPVAVCRGTLQLPVPDELEGVTNGSLGKYRQNIYLCHILISLKSIVFLTISNKNVCGTVGVMVLVLDGHSEHVAHA